MSHYIGLCDEMERIVWEDPTVAML